MNLKWIKLKTGGGVLCPICVKDHGCMIREDGALGFCLRVMDGCIRRRDGTPWAAKGGMGWMHALGKPRSAPDNLEPCREHPKLTLTELRGMIKQQQTALSPARLAEAAAALGLSEQSLRKYGIGYDVDTVCWSFPMFDGDGKPCGIRLRARDGTKRAVRSSRNGLFIPEDFESFEVPPMLCNGADCFPLLLLMPEGPTDAAAAADLRFRAIGRPSNMGGAEQAKELLERHDRQEVVIFADHDQTKWLADDRPFWPGWEGALRLAQFILPVCGTLKVVRPPGRTKDLRDWLREGGTAGMIHALLNNTQAATRSWIIERISDVYRWREGLRRQRAKQKSAGAISDHP